MASAECKSIKIRQREYEIDFAKECEGLSNCAGDLHPLKDNNTCLAISIRNSSKKGKQLRNKLNSMIGKENYPLLKVYAKNEIKDDVAYAVQKFWRLDLSSLKEDEKIQYVFGPALLGVKRLNQDRVAHGIITHDSIVESAEGVVLTSALEEEESEELWRNEKFLYVSPARLLNKEEDPFLSDLWSIGVLFFKILKGDYPLKDDEYRSLLEKFESEGFADKLSEIVDNGLSTLGQNKKHGEFISCLITQEIWKREIVADTLKQEGIIEVSQFREKVLALVKDEGILRKRKEEERRQEERRQEERRQEERRQEERRQEERRQEERRQEERRQEEIRQEEKRQEEIRQELQKQKQMKEAMQEPASKKKAELENSDNFSDLENADDPGNGQQPQAAENKEIQGTSEVAEGKTKKKKDLKGKKTGTGSKRKAEGDDDPKETKKNGKKAATGQKRVKEEEKYEEKGESAEDDKKKKEGKKSPAKEKKKAKSPTGQSNGVEVKVEEKQEKEKKSEGAGDTGASREELPEAQSKDNEVKASQNAEGVEENGGKKQQDEEEEEIESKNKYKNKKELSQEKEDEELKPEALKLAESFREVSTELKSLSKSSKSFKDIKIIDFIEFCVDSAEHTILPETKYVLYQLAKLVYCQEIYSGDSSDFEKEHDRENNKSLRYKLEKFSKALEKEISGMKASVEIDNELSDSLNSCTNKEELIGMRVNIRKVLRNELFKRKNLVKGQLKKEELSGYLRILYFFAYNNMIKEDQLDVNELRRKLESEIDVLKLEIKNFTSQYN